MVELVLAPSYWRLAAVVYVMSSRKQMPTVSSGATSTNAAAYDAYVRGRVIVSSENPDDNESCHQTFRAGRRLPTQISLAPMPN